MSPKTLSVKPEAPKKKRAGKRLAELLGPVEDLQSYVKADWWRHLFNANYLRTDGDVVEDATITRHEIDRLVAILQPAPDAKILDLCCGQGRHTRALAQRGFVNVTGLDRSHYLITRARSSAKREGIHAVFREGDARKLPFQNDTFDHVAILGNSFGYFESFHDDCQVLHEIRRVLKPTGQLLLDLTDGEFMREKFEPRNWEWIDKNYFVCRERCLSDDRSRLISREVITHVRKGVISDQFYAERLYSEAQMRDLLQECEFHEVKLDELRITSGKPNSDTGMMGRRMLYSARPKKQWTTPRKKTIKAKAVAVIMGDPRKSDAVKPSGAFDETDLDTVKKLKAALTDLPGYDFTYFDDHDMLISDARRIRAEHDYVLNLCDEGFGNLASRELHLPAFLEMLDIPYTGGPPQSLAYCYDKSLVRGVAREMDIPVPLAFLIRSDDNAFFELTLPFPVIVKPNFGDSSVGITARSVCYDVQELESAILDVRDRFGYDKPVLIEQFLTGKEVTVGLIGNPPGPCIALPIIEEDYSLLPEGLPKLCGYEAKWDPESAYWKALRSIRADLPEETEGFLIATCQRLFERLGCRDYARFDWRLDNNGTPRLLEANPNPGWCWDGHFARMAAFAGHGYGDMLGLILKAAEERIAAAGSGEGERR